MLLSEFEYRDPKDYSEKQRKALRSKEYRTQKNSSVLNISNLDDKTQKKILQNRSNTIERLRLNNKHHTQLVNLGKDSKNIPPNKYLSDTGKLQDPLTYRKNKNKKVKPVSSKAKKKSKSKKPYSSPVLGEKKQLNKPKATYQVLTPQPPTYTTVVPTASTGKVPANVSTSAIPSTNANSGPSSSIPNASKLPKKVKPKGIPYKKLALLAGVSLAGGVGYAAYKKRKERSDKGKRRGKYRIF